MTKLLKFFAVVAFFSVLHQSLSYISVWFLLLCITHKLVCRYYDKFIGVNTKMCKQALTSPLSGPCLVQ